MRLEVIYIPFKPKKGNQWSNLLLNSLDRVKASFEAKQFCFLGDFFLFCFYKFLLVTCLYFLFFLFEI